MGGILAVLYSISEGPVICLCFFQVLVLFMVSRIVEFFPQTYLTLYFVDTLEMDKVRNQWMRTAFLI